MGIADFFLPNWKHSNPEIRLEAVQDMNPKAIKQLLKIAATDTNSKVQLEAINKINDLDSLLKLIEHPFNPEINELFRDKVSRVISNELAKSGQEKATLILNKLKDQEILTRVISNVENYELKLIILDKIKDQELLCEIAQNNCGLKTASEIIKRLDRLDLLEKLSQSASNKKIRIKAETKLQELPGAYQEKQKQDKIEKKLTKICSALEKLKASADIQQISFLVEKSKEDWKQQKTDQFPLISERFKKITSHLEENLKRALNAKETILSLETLFEELQTLYHKDPADIDNKLDFFLKTWSAVEHENLTKDEFEPIKNKFFFIYEKIKKAKEEALIQKEEEEKKLTLLKLYHQEILEKSREIIATTNKTEWDTLITKWNSTVFYSEQTKELVESFNLAVNIFEEKYNKFKQEQGKQIKSEQEKLISLCEEVESWLEEDSKPGRSLKKLQDEWKKSGKIIPEFKSNLSPRFKKSSQIFINKQPDLKAELEWERWANLNLKEELCKSAAELTHEKNLILLAEKLKELKTRWKEIGPVTHNKSEIIWQNFKDNCDLAYQRIINEKKELLKNIEELFNSSEWEKTSTRIKELQKNWNSLGRFPYQEDYALNKKFKQFSNDFFERRRTNYKEQEEERLKNLELKQTISEEAELLSSSNDWNTAAVRLKELQKQWKEIGALPRNKGNQLWENFQKSCNSFFERYEAEKPRNLIKKIQLCEDLESLLAENNPEQKEKVVKQVINLQEEWKKIGPVSQEKSKEIWERFHKQCDSFFSKRREELKSLHTQYEENQKLKEELVEKAKELSNSTDWKKTGEELKKLQQEWKNTGRTSHKNEQELWTKFRGYCDYFFTQSKDFFQEKDRQREENLKKKRELCLKLALIGKLILDAPQEVEDEYVSREEQLHILFKLKSEIIVQGDKKATMKNGIQKVKEIQLQWKKIGPVASEFDQKIWNKFRQIGDQFFPRAASKE